MNQNEEIEKKSLEVLEGKENVECASAELHIKFCETCKEKFGK